MAKTDWRFADTVIPEDLNGIGEEINGLRTDISTRFDHADTTPLTLQPGLQVVHAEKDARFKLGEIQGRTLVNLLGQMGSMDSLNGWRYDPNTAVLDSTDKIEGMASVKGVISNGQYSDIFYSFPYESSKRYIALGELKTHGGATARIRVVESEGLVELSSPLLSSNIFSTAFFKVPLNAITSGKTVYFGTVFAGNNGSGGNVDALRIYEISDAEYQALDEMTPEQVAMKYPFVPSGIIGVKNPYVINTSGNLLPPFYNYEYLVDTHKVEGPYTIKIEPNINSPYAYSYIPFKVQPDTDYTLSIEGYNYYHAIFPRDLMVPNPPSGWSNSPSITFNSRNNSELLFLFRNANETLPADIKNPIITMGRHVNVFKPQRVTMFALETELHANPADGSSPDIMLEKQGQYFKLKKWEKRTLENFSGWLAAQARPGYKVFACSLPNSQNYSQTLIKSDGNQVQNTLPDNWASGDLTIIFNNYLYLSIKNTDSGWGERDELYEFTGDGLTTKFVLHTPPGFWIIPETVTASIDSINVNLTSVIGNEVTVEAAPTSGKKLVVNYKVAYVPTGDEIKAYFLGWRMANPENWGVPYSTGIKAWGKLNRNSELVSGSGTNVLPILISDQGYKPYEILYRLGVDSIEFVVCEEGLLLGEGDNLIEVGAGIVMREQVVPSQDNAKFWNLGNPVANPTSKAFKQKASRILSIYADNMSDERWAMVSGDSSSEIRGIIAQLSPNYEIDLTKIYSVTYVKLDNSPTQPIIGTIAANEKAQIGELTAGVAEALRRVSVVEQKKAEKDVYGPEWITPTLLNGWVRESHTFGCMKDDLGNVRLRGRILNGAVAVNTVIFVLPEGMRPKTYGYYLVSTYAGTGVVTVGFIMILVNGNVIAAYVPDNTKWINLDSITFYAEQ